MNPAEKFIEIMELNKVKQSTIEDDFFQYFVNIFNKFYIHNRY